MDQTPHAARHAATSLARIPSSAETPVEIERDIALTRDRIGNALAELEQKLDPRRPINEHPIAAVAVAFAVGVALGTRGRGNGSAPAASHDNGKPSGILSIFVHRLASAAASAASARLLAGINLRESPSDRLR